ncbi:MAG: hypothetical protein HDR92_06020 [Bacteroides sp.]|nr:hypothetical protein [Bacteroides sp.]
MADTLSYKLFAEFTIGAGTADVAYIMSNGDIRKLDKTYWNAQFAPSVGVSISDRWSVGVRATLQTNYSYFHARYNIATLYGQYSFLNRGAWSAFVEGKGSYYKYVCSRGEKSGYNLGEIGFSLGAKYSLTEKLSLVAHYIYTGVEVGNGWLNRPGGCISSGRVMLDFSPRRLLIGARYTF